MYALLPMDLAIYASILILFAVWMTAHVLLCVRLAQRQFLRGLAGFVVFPMAPYWGQSLHIKKLPTIWMVSALLYVLALIAGLI